MAYMGSTVKHIWSDMDKSGDSQEKQGRHICQA
jgi:hypothetical protein